MPLRRTVAPAAALLLAAGLCGGGAVLAVDLIERGSTRAVQKALVLDGTDWVSAEADGLQVLLTGTAPSEADRFHAVTVASSVIDSTRVVDMMEVQKAEAITAPPFGIEVLRNDGKVTLIGLIPTSTDREALRDRIAGLPGVAEVDDLLNTADYPAPDGWSDAVSFASTALRMLPRAKISVTASETTLTAISDSAAQQEQLDRRLRDAAPAGMALDLTITAPRPVVTPFTLRMVMAPDQEPELDSCTADSAIAQKRILDAAAEAGVPGTPDCILGLGTPSPRWGEAARAAITALAELGTGSVTLTDADVALIAGPESTEAEFDRISGDLKNALPPAFSLSATRQEARAGADLAAPEFTILRAPDSGVQIRGRLPDDRTRAAVTALAKARFGATRVVNATRLDPELPDGWPQRVLAGIDAMAHVADGKLTVSPEEIALSGRSGTTDAQDAITRALTGQLGGQAGYRIDVAYDEELDPLAALPEPGECIGRLNKLLSANQIVFEPGSTTIDSSSRDTLSTLVDLMADCEHVPMEIGGHTDDQGGEDMNLQLSQARADAVLARLAERRVDTRLLSARGYGEAVPVASNDTPEGREANRRIEFTLVEPTNPMSRADIAVNLARMALRGPAGQVLEATDPVMIRPRLRPNDEEADPSDTAPEATDAAPETEAPDATQSDTPEVDASEGAPASESAETATTEPAADTSDSDTPPARPDA